MQSLVKLAASGLVVAVLVSAAPATAQFNPYVTIRANMEEAQTKRQAAVNSCATSIANLRFQDQARVFDIAYVGFRSSDMRVIGNVRFGSASSEAFTCDVDYRGKIRRVQFG